MATARVRGIYSTAFVKLLLDQGFTIVQASQTQKERFRFEQNGDSPDLDIYDRRDLQGIQVLGKGEHLLSFVSNLHAQLDDAIVRRWPATADGIYRGIVKQVASDNTALVDIGSAVGIVRDANLARPGETILVQVERQYLGSKAPELSTEIKIPGRHAILLPGRQVKISKRILDSGTRERLRVLGDELANQKWGILWRTSAANALDSALREEVQALTKAGEQVLEKAEVMEAPAMLFEGLGFADVELPALSKRKLDDIRKQVNATIPGHHFYKACGDRVSAALDMAERMIEKGSLQSEVEELFKQTVEQEYPIPREWIEMEHAKLAGQVLHLGPALLESYSSETLMFELRRVFKRVGVYDGLAVPKEPDDYAVTKGLVGDWLLKTQYFSKDGELKGSYINMNTPIELYPYGIRYVDLEADICLWPDGRLEVLDLEKLEEALKKGVVTERLVGIAKARLEEVIKEI